MSITTESIKASTNAAKATAKAKMRSAWLAFKTLCTIFVLLVGLATVVAGIADGMAKKSDPFHLASPTEYKVVQIDSKTELKHVCFEDGACGWFVDVAGSDAYGH